MTDPRVTMHLTNAQAEAILRLADGCLQNYGTDDERAELAPLIAAELDRLDQQKPTALLDRLGASYRPDVARAAIYWDRYTTHLEQQVARALRERGQTVDDAVEPPTWEVRLQVVVPKVDQ